MTIASLRLSILAAMLACFAISPVAQSKLLEGALQQTDTLPPLSDRFQVDHPFSEEMLNQADNLDEWILIPPAVAGTWARESNLTLNVRDERTQRDTYPNTQSFARGSFTRGFQLDTAGNIWDCPRARKHRFETSSDGMLREYIIITGRRQMLVTGLTSLRDYGEVTLVDVDTRNNRITRVQRSVQVVQRSLLGNGMMQVDSVTSSYTPEGKLIETSHDRSFESRVAAFSPVNSLNGMDLQKSFQAFIQSARAAGSAAK